MDNYLKRAFALKEYYKGKVEYGFKCLERLHKKETPSKHTIDNIKGWQNHLTACGDLIEVLNEFIDIKSKAIN